LTLSSHINPFYLREIAALTRWTATCIRLHVVINSLTNSLEKYMDLISMRQKLVSSNIANADTPGYKTQDFDFQASLQSMLTGGQPQEAKVEGLATKNDGNNVDLDREARMLAENSMRFNVASNLMKLSFQQIREAIKEGPA
jgi:flagellar basal-body rod protein FlgB